MSVPRNIRACFLFFLVFLCLQNTRAYVTGDDCTESCSQRYHAHNSRSSSYSSGYSQQHPAPSGYTATSSSYMRTGNSVGSAGAYNGLAGHEDDLQVASSVYSPQVAKVSSDYQSTGGYGVHRGTSSYGSRVSGYGSSNYGATQDSSRASGYGSSNYGATQDSLRASGYGSSNYGAAQDSQVRQKFEDLKQKADSFVHSDAPPPVDSFSGVPITSHVGSSSRHSSQYSQQAVSSGQRYDSAGNILGVTYGTTGTEEDERQRLVPVPATLPAASALTAGTRKESHDSSISYSTSGVAAPEGLDYSISQSVPLGVTHTSSQQQNSKQFEELKRRAEAFVHEGGAPPSSSALSSSDNSLSQSSTHVQTLPGHATSHGTYVVPVRVTVTREHTVVPGATQEYYENTIPGGSATKTIKQESSYSSSQTSHASSQPGYVSTGNTVSEVPIGSSSSYSYNVQGTNAPPRVYTVGPQGSVIYPAEDQQQSSHSQVAGTSGSYGSSSAYTKQSNVHRDNVIVAGAVPIDNTEEAIKKSNKLFDLVSGYGTFLPAKEETISPATPTSSGLILAGEDGSSSGSRSSSSYSSQTSQSSRVSGSSGGVYQPVSGYSGVVPAGSVRTTTTTTHFSNPVPLQVNPIVPVGDPLTPPEVSGSYFSATGAGRQGYTSNYAATSGGYGVRNENLGYGSGGVRNENIGGVRRGGYGEARDHVAYNSQYAANRDAGLTSGYATKNAGYASNYAATDAALTQGLALNGDPTLCHTNICDNVNLIPGGTGGVKKYGISSSWSSKSQTVNGKTVQSKEAVVTVDDNGKVDTYATHS